jgi:hypothetical protein
LAATTPDWSARIVAADAGLVVGAPLDAVMLVAAAPMEAEAVLDRDDVAEPAELPPAVPPDAEPEPELGFARSACS